MKNFYLLLLAFISLQSNATPQPRVALVIGNSNYQNMGVLRNAQNDAQDMADTLRTLGFDVILGKNLSKIQMRNKIREFDAKINQSKDKNTVGLFYYAGHGLEVEGKNYLVAVDAMMEYQEDAMDEGIALNRIIQRMNYSKNPINIVILDACRNNPLGTRTRSAGMNQNSWGAINNAAQGLFIAYGTAPGRRALDANADGSGRNGLFTKHLLKNIKAKGKTLEQVFKAVRLGVLNDSHNKQITWQNNATTGDFYFTPRENLASSAPNPALNHNNLLSNTIARNNDKKNSRRVGTTFQDCPNCPQMIAIPAGSFIMGQGDDSPYNKPNHQVSIAQFNMATTEITYQQFKAFVDETDYKTDAEKNDGCNIFVKKWQLRKKGSWKKTYLKPTNTTPVTCVSWNDANQYTQWLSKKTNKHYRLPSEAEWEYAAMAGSNGHFSWGNDVACVIAVYGYSECGVTKPSTVKSHDANNFGLYEMFGNVSEWLDDCRHENYQGAPNDGSSWVDNCSAYNKHVFRGGSWILPASDMHASNRGFAPSTLSINDSGFRVASDD